MSLALTNCYYITQTNQALPLKRKGRAELDEDKVILIIRI